MKLLSEAVKCEGWRLCSQSCFAGQWGGGMRGIGRGGGDGEGEGWSRGKEDSPEQPDHILSTTTVQGSRFPPQAGQWNFNIS